MDEENVNPSKRARVGVSVEELQRIISKKDKEIDFLNQKFNYITVENEKLTKAVEVLMDKVQKKNDIENFSSEDEMLSENEKIEGSNFRQESQKAKLNQESQKSSEEGASSNRKVPNAKANVDEGKKRSKSVPVITTYNVNIKDIVESIDELLGHKNFNLRILGKGVVNIGVCTLDDFDKVKSMLERKKVEFYTYTPKGLRPFTVVIEGLSHSFEPQEILSYFEGLNMKINVVSLVKLGVDKWVVRISKDSDIGKFYEIRYVLRCKVHIRKFVRKGVTQCFNCQRFGHVSSNCRMSYRCVKCGGSHGPGKCSVPPKGENVQESLITDPITGQVSKRVGLPVKCVNCNGEGHVASSRECPRRIELVRKLEARVVSRNNVQPRALSTPYKEVKPGVSYASVAGSSSGKNVATNLYQPGYRKAEVTIKDAMNQYDFIDRDCRRFFGGGLIHCLDRIGNFAKDYRGLSNDGDKSAALLGMLLTLRQNG